MTPARSCRTCWLSETRRTSPGPDGDLRLACLIGRRPSKPPYVCPGHAPDQGRAPTAYEIKIAREFA